MYYHYPYYHPYYPYYWNYGVYDSQIADVNQYMFNAGYQYGVNQISNINQVGGDRYWGWW